MVYKELGILIDRQAFKLLAETATDGDFVYLLGFDFINRCHYIVEIESGYVFKDKLFANPVAVETLTSLFKYLEARTIFDIKKELGI